MIFKEKYKIVYCRNEYKEEFDNAYYNLINKKIYYRGHLIHRKDGVAIEYTDGHKEWYLNGIRCTEEAYKEIINIKNKKRVLDEI